MTAKETTNSFWGFLGWVIVTQLGCDIDIAGYAPDAMGSKVQLDFRRSCTIAKGAEACEFYYYLQGYASEDMATVKNHT